MHFSSTELSPVPALQRDAFQFYWTLTSVCLAERCISVLLNSHQCLPCREMHFSSAELSPVPVLPRDAFQFCWTLTSACLAERCISVMLVISACLAYRSFSVLLNYHRRAYCNIVYMSVIYKYICYITLGVCFKIANVYCATSRTEVHNIVACLVKARTVKPAKTSVARNGCVTRNNGVTVGGSVLYAVRGDSYVMQQYMNCREQEYEVVNTKAERATLLEAVTREAVKTQTEKTYCVL
jgi:hypothetical protein